jgi:hypothetical protein
MGFFSKVWKGLKKGVKKIARGIKKVVKKVGAAIGKLGIVGQIGMMFLMPYAMGALGSMFGATGALSSWSATLLGPQAGVFSRALGHTLNLINTAGTAVGNVYNSISSTISGALDKTGNFLKCRGFVATDPTNLISAIPTDPSKLAVEASKTTGVTLDTGKALGLKTPTPTLGGDALSSIASGTDALSQQVTQQVGTKVVKEEAQKGLLSKTVDRMKADIKDFDAYDYTKKLVTGTIESSVVGGAKQALAQKTAEAFGYKQPEGADYYSFNMPDLMEASRSNPSVFDTVDFLASNSGNAYYGTALKNNPYITNLLSDNTSAYQSYMSQFQNQLMQPQG